MGIEKGILYRRTEDLLRDYRAMKARVENLKNDLANHGSDGVTETYDEALQGYYFSRNISDMPHGTDISDKTGRVALEGRERYQKEFAIVWRAYVLDKENMKNELAVITRLLQMIEISISSLLPKEKEIITLFYVDGLQWDEISRKTQYEVSWCKRIRYRAIWYMSKSMTVGQYGKVY